MRLIQTYYVERGKNIILKQVMYSKRKIFKLPNELYDENELNNYIQEYFLTFETPPG
jgi:hypothetical protein